MTIPDLKSAASFSSGSFKVPCMVGRFKQSAVPGLGSIAVEDQRIYIDLILVGGETPRISEWHQTMLERLFTKEELVEGVKAGIRAMENSHRFDGYDEEALEIIGTGGLIDWVGLSTIILDDKRQMVYVGGCTGVDQRSVQFIWQNGRWFWSGERDELCDFVAEYSRKEMEELRRQSLLKQELDDRAGE